MTKYQKLVHAWEESFQLEQKSNWWSLVYSSAFNRFHYMGYLRETYHYTSTSPQTQVFATLFYDPNEQEVIKTSLQHAREEIGHNLLALNDLDALGADIESVKKSRPLPMTLAFRAVPTYLIQFVSPVCYLGYLFHLEYFATHSGPALGKRVMELKIPPSALSFAQEHIQVDPHHNKLMEMYVERMAKTDSDLDHIIYGAQAGCRAYGKMLEDAFLFGERDFKE